MPRTRTSAPMITPTIQHWRLPSSWKGSMDQGVDTAPDVGFSFKYCAVGISAVRGKPNEKRVVISSPPSTSGGANMMLTGRTIVLLFTMALATGGAAFGVHALMSAAGDVGTDYGLDTNGNGSFDWLVVEAQVSLPQAGTWDISADLSSPNPPPSGSCGYGAPPPVGILAPGTSPIPYAYPIAYVYERYFFTDGTQTVRMAFVGTDIARSGVDGPYHVHARLSIGGLPYMTMRPIADWGGPVVEWNYTTKAYAASQFEQPVRPATFTGEHTDSAVDLDADALADLLELRAGVHVNLAGHYSLNGYLSKSAGTNVVRFITYAYRDFDLATTDTIVVLRFRGDLIRQAGVDGPWDFSLTLYYSPLTYAGGNVTPVPIGTILPPQPAYYPEMLCETTSAYRAADFDSTVELLRYTGRFEELTSDRNVDGTYDALVIRAEVEVFATAGFDLSGVLAGSGGSPEIAKSFSQVWLQGGLRWAELSFAVPAIRRGGVDGPYLATLSIAPGARGIDPTTTYATLAYHATDFDATATVPAQP